METIKEHHGTYPSAIVDQIVTVNAFLLPTLLTESDRLSVLDTERQNELTELIGGGIMNFFEQPTQTDTGQLEESNPPPATIKRTKNTTIKFKEITEDEIAQAVSLIPKKTREWEKWAACLNVDPAIFHPDQYQPSKPARLICSECIVKIECLAFALTEPIEKFGVWGGTTPNKRKTIIKQHNLEHEDDESDDLIEESDDPLESTSV